jgi:hypothetical protein
MPKNIIVEIFINLFGSFYNMVKLDTIFYVIVGLIIFFSSIGAIYSKYFLYFLMFVGLNMFQFSFTKFCLLREILKKLGFKN